MLLGDGIFMMQDNMETSARKTRCFHVRFSFKIWISFGKSAVHSL